MQVTMRRLEILKQLLNGIQVIVVLINHIVLLFSVLKSAIGKNGELLKKHNYFNEKILIIDSEKMNLNFSIPSIIFKK